MESGPFQDLIKDRLKNLRVKLLDLGRRNPLIATKLNPRSNAHVRVVDELPDVLFYKLNNGQEMRFVSLPEIDDDPTDENTKAFRELLSNARLTDEIYLSELESVQRDADDYLDRTRNIERALKDRLRTELGLPERQKKAEFNLAQHARNNGITPSYDLPDASGEKAERHTDDNIQTLLLPRDLERKLNNVTSKCRTWIQETGLNVLHVAYGFLEWSDADQSETSFAPLILAAVKIEKRRSRNGAEFWVSGTGEEPEVNLVLAEKIKEFGMELPKFEGSSVEKYFSDVAQIVPRSLKFKVRRQVAVGVFPSARIAMYYDLDPAHSANTENEIVGSLLGGINTETSSPFADEYNVDEPNVERLVPCLVMDADSSQFSTLVDIASNKNVAVEGPPGTGKSQTIVNAIAAAIGAGKKVLFVAEKLAALNVVKSRLEAIGLGEFVLPLQAERSTREQVISSVRERIEMDVPRAVPDFDAKIEEFKKIRSSLAAYIETLTTPFATSGLNVHQVLGKSILTSPALADVKQEIIGNCNVPPSLLNVSGFRSLTEAGLSIEKAHSESVGAQRFWVNTELLNVDRFTVEEACDLALRCASAFRELAECQANLKEIELEAADTAILSGVLHALRSEKALPQTLRHLLPGLLLGDHLSRIKTFLSKCDFCANEAAEISEFVGENIDGRALTRVERIAAICAQSQLNTLDVPKLEKAYLGLQESLAADKEITERMMSLVKLRPEAVSWRFDDVAKAQNAVNDAGAMALSFRSAATDASGAGLLSKICAVGRGLQDKARNLNKALIVTANIPPEVLSSYALALRVPGIFRFLSSEYRRAVRCSRNIFPPDRFEKDVAASLLEELADFKRKERAFASDPQAQRLFDLHFRGVETDFETFERLARYYESINWAFKSPDKRPLRDFLRDGTLEELELLPELPAALPVNSYKALQERIIELEENISEMPPILAALGECIGVFRNPAALPPGSVATLAKRMKALLAERKTIGGQQVVQTFLGDLFDGWETPTAELHNVCSWASAAVPHAEIVTAILNDDSAAKAIERITAAIDAHTKSTTLVANLHSLAKLPRNHFTISEDATQVSELLNQAAGDSDGLFIHSAFATVLDSLSNTGTSALVADRLTRTQDLKGVGKQLEAIAIRSLARQVFGSHGATLTKYTGRKLDELRSDLARKDREIIELSRKQLRSRVYATAKPPWGNGVGKKSTWSELALIENEISKQQRFIPVRDLTERAGRALQELKPCWMMSPLAVAQYIKKGKLGFDLCIIDEASQMPPEAAIGALARSKQAVVVGDTNQLPPSSFFKKMIDDDDADEDETVLEESILEMANATFRPPRRLRWHYRSRHSGLIKFSNRLVYSDDLVVFPSATESLSRMGVEYRFVDGLYKAGTNALEARALVDAILQFMRTDPDRSLGVVTLNQKQRDLISEEFEYAVSRDRNALAYIEAWKNKNDQLEEFFIKNLENVQGDERDVIFIGTVYGPETKGARVMQRFGPINGLAGKRRLNVLFSRAREKIVTFSSMKSSDIVADENGNVGAYMLKRWLEYAASGVLEGGIKTEREPGSDFQIFVGDQIKAMGCDVDQEVGVVGYSIDIGVRHPGWAHGYVLGVECDGATYHSAKSARDRDRLRQEVLEGLGWRLHRIWSTDWFNNPQREADKLRKVIEARMEDLKAKEADFTRRPTAKTVPLDERAPTLIGTISTVQLNDMPDTLSKRSVPSNKPCVAVGDRVSVRYLSGDQKVMHVTISDRSSDVSNGIIYFQTPLAKALLGADVGDEVEVLVGTQVRSAVVENISRPSN